jgi:large subunit ribosomal protein L24
MYSKVRVNLDSDLRKKFGVRSYPVTVGDIVRVKSGKRKGEGGKVIAVDHSSAMVSIEGISVAKEDGKQKELFLRPADLVITRLDFSRHQRYDHLRSIAGMKNIALSEEPPEQPVPETVESEEPSVVESQESEAAPSEVDSTDEDEEELTEPEEEESEDANEDDSDEQDDDEEEGVENDQ